MRMLVLCIVLCLWIQESSCASLTDSVIDIETSLGSIRGRVLKSVPSGKSFYAFMSVPYAESPLGRLRFASPRLLQTKLSSWKRPDNASERNSFDATKFPTKCPQWKLVEVNGLSEPPLQGQEDCLALNVFVPASSFEAFSGHKSASLPVMFWIHGGGFITGTSHPDMHGPEHFMDTESVIIVSVSYRLGVLGFLSLGNEQVSGNMGMKDQIVAMQWVQKYIADFGGDPTRVTIFGNSAGGVAVMYHILSQQSRGLFSGAIAQSGPLIDSSLMRFSVPRTPLFYSQKFLKHIGCGNKGQETIPCLQHAPLTKIMEGQKIFEKFAFLPNPWKPIVDVGHTKNAFLEDEPVALLQQGRFIQVI